MIKHLVFWKLLENAEGNSLEENAARIKQLLEALPAQIPEIGHLEVGRNQNPTAAAWDIAVYSEFDNWEDLAVYQAHPAHQQAGDFVGKVRSERCVVDYEI